MSVLLLSLLLSLGPVAPGAMSQAPSDTATFAGVVHDQHGNAVQSAAVTVRNTATGVVVTTSTDANGRFSTAGLAAGVYAIEVLKNGFATARRDKVPVTLDKADELAITLTVAQLSEQVDVSARVPEASKNAPSQGSLSARSAQSIISDAFIRDFTSPIADYTEVTQMSPGTFSVSPNGVGLGDTKTYFRGFKDGQYSMTFDGIPFNDTNDPTHHSWAFFPSQFLGGTVFDRSPGSAATVGPSTFGGSVNLLSRSMAAEQQLTGTASYGAFNTSLYDMQYDSGGFGPGDRSRLLLDAHQMQSDGYQTYNHQKRDGYAAKYQYAFSDATTLSAFSGVIDLHANTPKTNGPTRAQVDQFGRNYLLSADPAQANYYGYNFYHVPTDFEYVGLKSSLGHGWSIDNKVYTLRYYNKQNYNSATAISATSATDKLNSYRKYGNLLPLTQESRFGVLRTGLWSEYAKSDRFQTPSDPRTWVDAALPNFHEKFNTTTLQPYAEYQLTLSSTLSVTPGAKLAYYKQDFTQFADNGKTVGNLGGAPSVNHVASYRNWLPSFDIHYLAAPTWSLYAQAGKGNNIPPTSVFDVKNAKVATLPKPTLTTTYQVGSVWKSERATLDLDTYRIQFENDYSSTPDPVTGEPVYYLNGASLTKGVEAESTLVVGGGLSVYLNGTIGSARYTTSGRWVQNAPRDTETLGLNYQASGFTIGFFNKRVGRMFNDNGDTHEAVAIAPFNITNLFVNYTVGKASRFHQTKIRLAINNLFDNHSITGVNPASTKTSIASPGDILTIMPARAISVTMTVGFSKRP